MYNDDTIHIILVNTHLVYRPIERIIILCVSGFVLVSAIGIILFWLWSGRRGQSYEIPKWIEAEAFVRWQEIKPLLVQLVAILATAYLIACLCYNLELSSGIKNIERAEIVFNLGFIAVILVGFILFYRRLKRIYDNSHTSRNLY